MSQPFVKLTGLTPTGISRTWEKRKTAVIAYTDDVSILVS